MKWKAVFNRHLHGLLYSYSQIFFARSRWFGALLLLTSCFHPVIGLAGLLAVLLSNILAEAFTMDATSIHEGIFGFCSVLVGMGIGAFFEVNMVFFVLLFISAALCLLLTAAIRGFLLKYQLPFMGLPFLMTMWLLLLAARYFTNLHFIVQDSSPGLLGLFPLFQALLTPHLPEIIVSFCRSLGAVFFQSDFFPGFIIAIGIFFYSRISFTLAAIGFAAAFSFYQLAGIDTQDLARYFVGSNYIFIAIALGGFFIVPNAWSYLSVLAIIPLVTLIHYGSSALLGVFQLPAYTLSLTLTTLFFLYLLKWRSNGKYIHSVQQQFSSPEKNLYHFLTLRENYRFSRFYPVSLPFWGEWLVSQAHDGKITHLGDWSKAFDFIITDEEKKSFVTPGTLVRDFYCYNKPVLAPGDGTVEKIIDNIDDNAIADVNTKQNWGNSLVVNHGNGLYSQLSHLRKNSFKVKEGDAVKRGDLLALCGNSGRSPEPHIHFQLQTTPVVGSKTLEYPVASYVVRQNLSFQLKTFEKPKEGELIRNPEINSLLKHAFNFVPGKTMTWTWKGKNENWEMYTDAWNRLTLWCAGTGSLVRIENDGIVFRCTSFEGNKDSLLYHFYLSCYKVFLGFYSDLRTEEKYPVLFKTNFVVQWLEDLTAPFIQVVKSTYSLRYLFADDLQYTTQVELASSSVSRIGSLKLKELDYRLHFNEKGFDRIVINEGKKQTVATCVVQ